MTHLYSKIILLALTISSQIHVSAQSSSYSPVSKELYNTILHMDSLLFDAVNTGNVEKEGTFFMKDLEFYHDTGGLDNYEVTMEKLRSIAKNNPAVRRELIKKQ